VLIERQLGVASEQREHATDLLLSRVELRARDFCRMLRLLELGARADARLLQMLLALEFVLLIAERIARGRATDSLARASSTASRKGRSSSR
jgi:hypothetical protein